MQEDSQQNVMPTQEVIRDILNTPGIEGITIIGGEPFWHAQELQHVARACQEAGLGVMVFTGLTLSYIEKTAKPEWLNFLSSIDLLIDGPYIQSRRITNRRWIGSSNQQIRFLSTRYNHLKGPDGWALEDDCNTIEIRMTGTEISINGWPDFDIIELAKKSITTSKKET
jgi:anaerobic ribonucleoside-triphosphate reductase activating protein